MWGGIIIASISSYPLSTSKLLFSCPCKGQDLHNAKWSCGSGVSDTRQTYYTVAPAHGVVADGKRRRIFSSSFFPHRHSTVPILQRWVEVCWIYSEWKNLERIFQRRVQVCWLWPRASKLCVHTPETGGRFVGSAQRAKRLCTGEQSSFTFSAAFLHQIHWAFKVPGLTQLHRFDHHSWFCLNLPCRAKSIPKWMIQ